MIEYFYRGLLQEFIRLLDAEVAHKNEQTTSRMRQGLETFSLSTHGFGQPAILAGLSVLMRYFFILLYPTNPSIFSLKVTGLRYFVS